MTLYERSVNFYVKGGKSNVFPESISTNATGALYCVVFCRSQRTTWKEKLTPSPLIRNHTSEEFFVRLKSTERHHHIWLYSRTKKWTKYQM